MSSYLGGGGGDATIRFTPAASTPTSTSVAVDSVNPVTIIAANPNRKALLIYNNSTQVLNLSLIAAATAANAFTTVAAGATFRLDGQLLFTSAIYGLWAGADATGTARVVELT